MAIFNWLFLLSAPCGKGYDDNYGYAYNDSAYLIGSATTGEQAPGSLTPLTDWPALTLVSQNGNTINVFTTDDQVNGSALSSNYNLWWFPLCAGAMAGFNIAW